MAASLTPQSLYIHGSNPPIKKIKHELGVVGMMMDSKTGSSHTFTHSLVQFKLVLNDLLCCDKKSGILNHQIEIEFLVGEMAH